MVSSERFRYPTSDVTRAINEQHRCPDCASILWRAGARDGQNSITIKCGSCGSVFWVAPPLAPQRIQRYDPTGFDHKRITLQELLDDYDIRSFLPPPNTPKTRLEKFFDLFKSRKV